MYTVEIDFQTKKEDIHLTRGKFISSEAAAAFAVEFVKPYVDGGLVMDGEWRVFDSEYPHTLAERHYAIRPPKYQCRITTKTAGQNFRKSEILRHKEFH